MRAMQEGTRVDLIFPRSGQVLPIYVPDAMSQSVARRNLHILLSLYGKDALSDSHADYLRSMFLNLS